MKAKKISKTKFKACFHTRKKNNEPDDLYRKILAQEISREKNDNDNNKEMMKI